MIFILNKIKQNFNLGCSHGDHLEYLFFDLPETWSECVYLDAQTVCLLRDVITNNNISQMYLFEIINELISHNVIFHKHIIDKKNIIKINNQKDITKAKKFI